MQPDLKQVKPEDPPILPLWINGHALLTLGQDLHPVRDPQGLILRKLPLCGDDELAEAQRAATAALAGWQALHPPERQQHLRAVALLLQETRYNLHFIKLIREEYALDTEQAELDVQASIAALSMSVQKSSDAMASVSVLHVAPGESFSTSTARLANAVLGGNTVIILPALTAPSALLALAELCSRAGMADGVVNLLYARSD